MKNLFKSIFLCKLIFFTGYAFSMQKTTCEGVSRIDIISSLLKSKEISFMDITEEPTGKTLGEYYFKGEYYFGEDKEKIYEFNIYGEIIESEIYQDFVILNIEHGCFIKINIADLYKIILEKNTHIEWSIDISVMEEQITYKPLVSFFLRHSSINVPNPNIINPYRISNTIAEKSFFEYSDLLQEGDYGRILEEIKKEGTPNIVFEIKEINLSILHYFVINSPYGIKVADEFLLENHGTKISMTTNTREYMKKIFYKIFLANLLYDGADYTIQCKINGNTAIHEATCRNVFYAMEIFCKHCNLNILNRNGDTPLHLAIKLGNYEFVKMLVEAGANYLIKNVDGLSALELAKKSKTSYDVAAEASDESSCYYEGSDETSGEFSYYESSADDSHENFIDTITKTLAETSGETFAKAPANATAKTFNKIYKLIKRFHLSKQTEYAD